MYVSVILTKSEIMKYVSWKYLLKMANIMKDPGKYNERSRQNLWKILACVNTYLARIVNITGKIIEIYLAISWGASGRHGGAGDSWNWKIIN